MDGRLAETIDTYDKSALSYQDRFMEMDLYDDTYEGFCRLIEKTGARVFEIGVGPGNITRHLCSARPDIRLYGIDLAPRMVELARENNPQAEFDVMDCREIGKINAKYDAVVCGFCMPYLSREECAKLIEDSAALLESGGLLYASAMEGDYGQSGFETTSFSGQGRVYVYYHQADFLSECFARSGFELVNLQRKRCLEPDGSFLTDMIFIVRKI